jgi:hypothetical protein
MFRKLDLLLSSGKKEGQKPYLLGPLVELASVDPGLRLAQPQSPTARVSVLPFYLKTEEDPAFET